MPVKKIKLPDSSVIDINDSRIHIYRTLTGTAADTTSPYNHAEWDVTDSTITEYVDGMVVCLKVPVAGHGTYGTGFQINNLGYKPVVYNVNSMVSTRYGVGSVIWCVYNATQTGSLYINSTAAVTVTGCWQVQDYDANTNTIGYQLRTNSSTRPVSSTTYRYRLMFSSLDNSKWVPATNSTSTNATSARTVNQEVINPWGRIVYYSTTTARTAGQSLSATAQWDRYTFNLGYSFNTGNALDLTFPGPVYIKCIPQAGGGAIIDSTTPYTQSLPSSADGKIYIYLGQAYSASEVELIDYHPVLYHDGSKIAIWTGAAAESDLFDCVMTQENNVWSCDHTWAEIYAAHQAGKLVRLTQSNDSIYMPASIGSNFGMFSSSVSASILGTIFEVINTFIYDGNHTEYSDDWTFFNEAHPIFSFDNQSKLNGIETGAQVNVQSDWNQSDSTADDFIKNKPTIPDAVSGVNDGTNWTSITIGSTTKAIPQGGSSTLSALTDTTITTPSDGQVLTYDNATSKWVNGDMPTEVLMCTLTASGTSDPNTGEWTMSYSCDKTDAEIYAAYVANKSVLLKVVGEDHSWDTNAPEPYTVYRLAFVQSSTGGNNEPWYFFSFQNSTICLFEAFKIISPTTLPSGVYLQHFDRVSGDLSDTALSSVTPGWYFSTDNIAKPQNTTNGNLASLTSTGDYNDSGIASTDVSTAITNSHTHSNKTILDYIPSTLGTAGQVLRVNSGATGLEFGTVSGGLTNYDFTHTANTTVSVSTTTVTFAANTRGSAMLTISADLGLTIACNNGSDNYIWVKNTGSSEVDVTISGVTKNSTNVSNVYVPSDGISVPAGGLCEIGVVVNTDGAFITSRNDLAL